MQFLHKYQTVTAFTQDYNGTGYTEPWVSLTVENDKVDYNKNLTIIDFHPVGQVLHYAEWRAKASHGELIENVTVMGQELVETSYGSGIIYLTTRSYEASVYDGADHIFVDALDQ